MSLYRYRHGKDAFLKAIAALAHRAGLTPNMITAAGLALGLACGLALAYREVPVAVALGLGSVLCDLLDGAVARIYGMQSRTGLYFDSLADRLGEFAVVVGALAGGIVGPWGFLAIIGSASLLAMRCLSYRFGRRTDYILFGRTERLVCIGLGLLLSDSFLSTLCFVGAGLFGLFSAAQILVTVHWGATARSPDMDRAWVRPRGRR